MNNCNLWLLRIHDPDHAPLSIDHMMADTIEDDSDETDTTDSSAAATANSPPHYLEISTDSL